MEFRIPYMAFHSGTKPERIVGNSWDCSKYGITISGFLSSKTCCSDDYNFHRNFLLTLKCMHCRNNYSLALGIHRTRIEARCGRNIFSSRQNRTQTFGHTTRCHRFLCHNLFFLLPLFSVALSNRHNCIKIKILNCMISGEELVGDKYD